MSKKIRSRLNFWLIREIEVHCTSGMNVVNVWGVAGILNKKYYSWRRKFDGLNRARLAEIKNLEKEIQRLKKIVAGLELDRLVRNESLDYLKPKVRAHQFSIML